MSSAPVYQGVLKRLAAIAVALGTTSAGAAEQLATIPLDMAEKLVEGDELQGLTSADRLRLLEVLANDPRPAVRARIASRLATPATLDERTEALLDQLALDPDERVRDAVVATLQRLLPEVTGLERTSLVGRWATSSRPEHRLAIARVLQHRFVVLWEDVILEHLSHDESAATRRAAWHAAEARGWST